MLTKSSVAFLTAAVLLAGVAKAASAQQTRDISAFGNDLTSDFKYLANSVTIYGEGIVTSLLDIAAQRHC
jgi:hypothetical protein